jgi:hypothetical protein
MIHKELRRALPYAAALWRETTWMPTHARVVRCATVSDLREALRLHDDAKQPTWLFAKPRRNSQLAYYLSVKPQFAITLLRPLQLASARL